MTRCESGDGTVAVMAHSWQSGNSSSSRQNRETIGVFAMRKRSWCYTK